MDKHVICQSKQVCPECLGSAEARGERARTAAPTAQRQALPKPWNSMNNQLFFNKEDTHEKFMN